MARVLAITRQRAGQIKQELIRKGVLMEAANGSLWVPVRVEVQEESADVPG